MSVNNKFLTNHLFFFNLLIINNYFLHLISANIFFLKFNLIAILIYFFFFIFKSFKNNNNLIVILIIYYLIIILGSPTQDHDARSIWLFHAKRIYYDYNIYSQLDGYGEFSQNDYNPFVASLSASLGHLVNNWNEVLPKFSNLILTVPAILFLNFFFKNKLSKIFFFLSVLIIFDKRIVNGEMDAILALYLVSTLLIFFQFFLNKNLPFKLFVFEGLLATTFATIFLLIKSEAIVSFLFILFILFIFKYFRLIQFELKKLLILIIFPFSFFLHWKLKVFNSGIKNWYIDSIDYEFIKYRLFNFKLYIQIFEGLLLNKSMFISCIIFFSTLSIFLLNYYNSYFIVKKNSFENKFYLFTSIYCFLYFIFLFFIFIFGKQETKMFLEQGAFRYTQLISFSLVYSSFLIIDRNILKKN
jgi:hypothetical protein